MSFSDFRQTLNQPLTVTAPFSHQAETFKSFKLGWIGSLDRRPAVGPALLAHALPHPQEGKAPSFRP